MGSPATVEDYLADLPPERRARLEAIRSAARSAAPEATEVIAYGMPALRSHGRQFLVSYAAFKRHDSLFPASGAVVNELGDEIAPYVAGRGTIQFPLAQPIPIELVTKVVRIRVAENAARASGSG
jgi:uncharacterized protein YdhG (YjbR/CyaY superfamily)